MDYPDHPISLQGVSQPFNWTGRAAYLNSVNADRILVFCLSEHLSDALFDKFRADACVEIKDPATFLHRAQYTIASQPRFADSGLLHGSVEYYDPSAAVRGDIKDPRHIPFFKHSDYRDEREYRLVVSLGGGLRLLERIVLPTYDLEADAVAGKEAKRVVCVGGLRDIVAVHKRARPTQVPQ